MDAVTKKKESEIQTAICKYLASKHAFFYRHNNTPIWDKNLRNGFGAYRGMGTYAMKGVSDIVGVDAYGSVYFIECKTKRGKLSSDQLLFKKRCERHNALYIVATCVEDVENANIRFK